MVDKVNVGTCAGAVKGAGLVEEGEGTLACTCVRHWEFLLCAELESSVGA